MKNWTDYADGVQEEIKQLIRDLCAIPAPSNHEEKRAGFCRKWFVDNGFENVTIDPALNVIAPLNVTSGNPVTVIMAHMDTVFPDMEPMPFEEKDGFMYSPGVSDDTANLAVMMVCARIFKENAVLKNSGMIFVANSGEEGLGNLKGSREIVKTYGKRITEFISIDSSVPGKIYTGAVGSRRYKVTVETEGGHSFGNFGNRNAIHILSSIIGLLYTVKVPVDGDSITTYNVGTISGGTSVNTIAQSAEMLCEYRSDSRKCLEKMQKIFEEVIETYRAMGIRVEVQLMGERPCAGEVDEKHFEDLKNRVKKSMKKIIPGLTVTEHTGSTDCNIPLAEGIPALAFGTCSGSGIHTREEKLDVSSLPDGTRILLDFLLNSYGLEK